MGKIYNVVDGVVEGFPNRDAFLEKLSEDEIPTLGTPVLFHPMDVVEFKGPNKSTSIGGTTIYERKVYGENVTKYTIIVLGVLTNGERVEVVIDGLPIFFDVLIGKSADENGEPIDMKTTRTSGKAQEARDLVSEGMFKTDYVEKYPCINFSEHKNRYMRVFCPNIFVRDKKLESFREEGFETATDIRRSQWLNHTIVSYNITVADWAVVTPSKYKTVQNKTGTKHIIFTKIDRYVPVNVPLSKEVDERYSRICEYYPELAPDKIPAKPVYFSFGWDIEVYGSGSEFPVPTNKQDVIFQIGGGIYKSTQKDPILAFCICQKDMEFTDGGDDEWDWIRCKDERELLQAYFDIMAKFQMEFKFAFNNYNFDNPFIYIRANQAHMDGLLESVIDDISPIPLSYYRMSQKVGYYDSIIAMEKIKMEGSFDSHSERFVLKIPGCIDVDIMVYLKRTTYKKEDTLAGHALRSYLEKYDLPNKLDVSVEEMFRSYRENDGKLLKEVADYCVVDGLSCQRLADKVSCVVGLLSLGHLSLTSPYSCNVHAGGRRVTNAIYCMGKRNKIAYTEYPKKTDFKGKYPGAHVFNPRKGRYIEAPIMALDYQSLYPSIMRGHNMSSETFTTKEEAERLRDIGYDIHEFTYTLTESGKDREVTVYFVREDAEGKRVLGVYPQCLEMLTDLRNIYKKGMKSSKDPLLKDLYNEKQKAVKILSNTIYGKIGSPMFNLYNVFISAAITMYGRKILMLARDVAEEVGMQLIYGDSVTGNTPVILKQNGTITIVRVDSITDDWEDRGDGKEYHTFKEETEIWEKDRFVKIYNFIRHKTDKRIWRVNTHTGLVDVTSDHSMIKEDGTPVKPEELCDQTCLLHTTLPVSQLESKSELTIEEVWVWGFFMAEGSCGKYDCPSGLKYSWAINNNNLDLLGKCKDRLPFETKILDTLESSGVYKLVPVGNIRDRVIEYRSLFYNSYKEKRVPDVILNSNKEICQAFFDGFFDGDGCVKDKEKIGCTRFDQKGQETCLRLWILLKKCGYENVSINSRPDKPTVYRLTYSNRRMRKSPNIVKKKYVLHEKYDDYVYDFSTESQRFHAGVGNLVLHNTDSVFFKDKDSVYASMTSAERVAKAQRDAQPIADEINRRNRALLGNKDQFDTIKMNLDKFLYPATFLSKKKYCGLDWDIGDQKGGLYLSGIEATKRGKTALLKDASFKVINQLNDVEYKKSVLDCVLDTLKLATEEIGSKPRDYFYKRMKYSKGKSGVASQFIERMEQRALENPALYNIPESGTYFEVAMVKTIDHLKANGCLRGAKVSDRMEFANVIEALNLPIDKTYYLDDILGSLARFINSDDKFKVDAVDAKGKELALCEIDRKSQGLAEKFLKEKLIEITGGTGYVSLTQVKRNRKALHLKYKPLGPFLQNLIEAYNDNIVGGVVEYWLAKSKKCEFEIAQGDGEERLSSSEIKKRISGIEVDMMDDKTKQFVATLYKQYRQDLQTVSKNEKIDDVGKWIYSDGIGELSAEDTASLSEKICDHINGLRKYYSMKSKDDMDDIEKALEIVFRHIQ